MATADRDDYIHVGSWIPWPPDPGPLLQSKRAELERRRLRARSDIVFWPACVQIAVFANKSQAVGSLSLSSSTTTPSSYSTAPPSSSLRGFTTLQIPITEQQAIDPAHVGDFTSGSSLSLVCLVATFHNAAVTEPVKIIINTQSGSLCLLTDLSWSNKNAR